MSTIKKQTKSESNKEKVLAIITGCVAGLANGLFGGGGGMVVVPMLVYFLSYQNSFAHATAILIILPISILSSILYASFGIVNLKILLPVGAGVVFGGVLGALLLNKISNKWISVIFSLVMAFAGLKMLFF